MAHPPVLTPVSEPPHCSSCGCGYADLPRCPQCSGLGYILPPPTRDEHAVAATPPRAEVSDAVRALPEVWRVDEHDDTHSTSSWDQGFAYGRE